VVIVEVAQQLNALPRQPLLLPVSAVTNSVATRSIVGLLGNDSEQG
jgi:hypothetical protein